MIQLLLRESERETADLTEGPNRRQSRSSAYSDVNEWVEGE
jgi:hypothetical protein